MINFVVWNYIVVLIENHPCIIGKRADEGVSEWAIGCPVKDGTQGEGT
jgi:hypothetical protein